MVNGWTPKLNSKGDIVSGSGWIELKGNKIAEPGWNPQFKTDDIVAYIGEDDRLFEFANGQSTRLSQQKLSFFGAGAGKHVLPQVGDIALSVDPSTGDVVRLIEHNGSNTDRSILINDQPVIQHDAVSDVCIRDGLLVFSVWTGKPHDRGTWGSENGGTIKNLRVFHTSWEGRPIPIYTPEGPWVLVMTDKDLRLHPWNSGMGYVIATGVDNNFNADAKFINGNIHVVWNTTTGLLQQRIINLTDPRISVESKLDLPTPEQPKEPEVPELPNFKATVERIRLKYPTPLDDQHWRFLVELAQQLRAKLFRKDGGTNVFVPPLGFNVSQDIIILDGFWIDVLGDAENTAEPAWDAHPSAGEPEKWIDVSHINLGNGPTPPDKPEDPPTGICYKCDALEARIDALAAIVQTTTPLAMFLELSRKTNERLEVLEKMSKPRYKIVGNTASNGGFLGHKHSVGDLKIEEA